MYAPLSQIPGGLELLREKLEEHVKKAGQVAISKLVGETGADVDVLDPKVYVNALLEVHGKNLEMVSRSFRGDSLILRKSGLAKGDLEGALNRVVRFLFYYLDTHVLKLARQMVLFKYIEDLISARRA
jgi:hypothetical protein